ncbi:MAG: ribosome maturation factor RimP [Synergistetes bacterium]|nr:ribosome maturation factor RimP [Synergistota bacterium]
MDFRAIARQIESAIQKTVEREGVELLGVEFTTEGGRRVLRIYIDSSEGISLRECERVSRAVDPLLDSMDIIEGRYFLEVSSPGLNRPLFKKKDYERFKGSTVKINTIEPVEGRRNFTGEIIDVGESEVIVKVNGVEFRISFENINKARLVEEPKLKKEEKRK